MIPLKDVVDHLRRAAPLVRPALERVMVEQMAAAATLASSFIGTEQPGWDPLAASTLASKERRGYPTPAPLEATGQLKASIRSAVVPVSETIQGIIGTDDPTALFHELGTSRMPPRPFLGPALIQSEPIIAAALAGLAQRALTPGEEP